MSGHSASAASRTLRRARVANVVCVKYTHTLRLSLPAAGERLHTWRCRLHRTSGNFLKAASKLRALPDINLYGYLPFMLSHVVFVEI